MTLVGIDKGGKGSVEGSDRDNCIHVWLCKSVVVNNSTSLHCSSG